MLRCFLCAQVSFGRDFEQQLSFCVEARATFCNLEPVVIQLIHVSSLNPGQCVNVQTHSYAFYLSERRRRCSAVLNSAPFLFSSDGESFSHGDEASDGRESLTQDCCVCPGRFPHLNC